jgi:hypothetical protein
VFVTRRIRGFGGIGLAFFFGSVFTISFTKVGDPSSTTAATTPEA